MVNLNIGTWNIKNSYILINRNEYKLDAIIDLLENGKLNIIGLQEVNPFLARKLYDKLKKLDNGYNISSYFQRTLNPIKNLRVEYNLIISNLHGIGASKNIDLPSWSKIEEINSILNIRNRNAVHRLFSINESTVDFYNTCFTYNDLNLNKMEFDVLYTELSRSQIFNRRDTILVGNLNVPANSAHMEYYSSWLSKIHMKVIKNDNRTYKEHKENQPVDYIIVPTTYIVDSVECIDDYSEKISTHNPVIVKIRK